MQTSGLIVAEKSHAMLGKITSGSDGDVKIYGLKVKSKTKTLGSAINLASLLLLLLLTASCVACRLSGIIVRSLFLLLLKSVFYWWALCECVLAQG